jgi:hypothetical protein
MRGGEKCSIKFEISTKQFKIKGKEHFFFNFCSVPLEGNQVLIDHLNLCLNMLSFVFCFESSCTFILFKTSHVFRILKSTYSINDDIVSCILKQIKKDT